MLLSVQLSAAGLCELPADLVMVTTCPDTAVAKDPSMELQVPPEVPATLKPAGKVILIFPVIGMALTVVKVTVTFPETLWTREAGCTFVELSTPVVVIAGELAKVKVLLGD